MSPTNRTQRSSRGVACRAALALLWLPLSAACGHSAPPNKVASAKDAELRGQSQHVAFSQGEDTFLEVPVPADRLMGCVRSVAAILDDAAPCIEFERMAAQAGKLKSGESLGKRWAVTFQSQQVPLEIDFHRTSAGCYLVGFYGPETLVSEIRTLCAELIESTTRQ